MFSAKQAALNWDLEDAVKVYDMLHHEPRIGLKGGLEPATVRGRITLENVEFTYPTRPDAKVLKGLSLTVEAGTVTALIGPSGSGKSTVMALLERFYNPDKGRITLDGTPITELNPCWLRRQLAIVSQEPVLFDKSIRENLVYGCTDRTPSQKEIEDAAKAAKIYTFITTKCANGWRTKVGSDGFQLSGGQKQRVAIARALLKDPKILLLDEATSALDNESEALVQEALDRLMVGRTTIVIAHRLSTIQNADKIVAIKDGVAVEEGTHEELMKTDGVYRSYRLKQRHSSDVGGDEDEDGKGGGGGGGDGGGDGDGNGSSSDRDGTSDSDGFCEGPLPRPVVRLRRASTDGSSSSAEALAKTPKAGGGGMMTPASLRRHLALLQARYRRALGGLSANPEEARLVMKEFGALLSRFAARAGGGKRPTGVLEGPPPDAEGGDEASPRGGASAAARRLKRAMLRVRERVRDTRGGGGRRRPTSSRLRKAVSDLEELGVPDLVDLRRARTSIAKDR